MPDCARVLLDLDFDLTETVGQQASIRGRHAAQIERARRPWSALLLA